MLYLLRLDLVLIGGVVGGKASATPLPILLLGYPACLPRRLGIRGLR